MVFQENYSKFYNIFYKDKDYKSEANFIDKLIRKYLNKGGIHLLDLACGTGKHVFELEEIGYKVSGSDISEQMIIIAREEALARNSSAEFFNFSFQDSYKIEKEFDIVISMFSAIDYLTEFSDLRKSLDNIHNLLTKDGLFIFDYWNGNAVVRDFSPVRFLRKKDNKYEILRISKTDLFLEEQIANVEFTCMFLDNDQIKSEFEEVHRMRFFYFKEIEIFLNLCGFEIIHRSTFLDTELLRSPYDWNISIVAKKNM
jgi:SAM-dependent methyltransferase